MADKKRTFPTEMNRSSVYLGLIVFHCNLGEYSKTFVNPKCSRNPSITFAESR